MTPVPGRVACVFAVIAALAITVRPLPAQFEEPDTIPRLAVGPFLQLDFRGARGTDDAGQDIGFGDAIAVGARLEYRLTGTLTAGALGSFTRVEETLDGADGRIVRADRFTVWQMAGELLLRVKAGIPGYFVVGGGARHVRSGSDDPRAQSHDIKSFTEPLGIFGAGLEVASTRRSAIRVDVRVDFVSPAEQTGFKTKSLETDWSLGVGFMFRL